MTLWASPSQHELSADLARAVDLFSRTTARELDDLARARIRARLQAQLDAIDAAGATRRRHQRWSGRSALALGALALALALLAALWWAPDDGRLRPTALAQLGFAPVLVPYLTSGETELAARQLGRRRRRISLSRAAVVRAAIPGVGFVALIGPGELDIRRAEDAAIELRLSGGLLLSSIDGDAGERVRVRAGRSRVEVIGTVFAVDARGARDHTTEPHVAVTRGVVRVSRGAAAAQRIVAAQVLHGRLPGDAAPARPRAIGESAIGRALAASLHRHARSAPRVSPAGDSAATLVVRGRPAHALVSLVTGGDVLGAAPLAVRLPRGRVALRVVAPGHSPVELDVQLRRGVAQDIGFALQARPIVVEPPRRPRGASRASPDLRPSPRRAPRPAPRRDPRHERSDPSLSRPTPNRTPASAGRARAPAMPQQRPVARAQLSPRALYRAAEQAMKRGRSKAARAALTELVRRFPADRRASNARFELARLSYARGEPDRAAAELRRMLASAASNHPLIAAARLLACRVELGRRRVARAERCFSRLLRRHPRAAQAEDALYALARLAARRRDCATARARAIRYQRRYPRGRYARRLAARVSRCRAH